MSVVTESASKDEDHFARGGQPPGTGDSGDEGSAGREDDEDEQNQQQSTALRMAGNQRPIGFYATGGPDDDDDEDPEEQPAPLGMPGSTRPIGFYVPQYSGNGPGMARQRAHFHFDPEAPPPTPPAAMTAQPQMCLLEKPIDSKVKVSPFDDTCIESRKKGDKRAMIWPRGSLLSFSAESVARKRRKKRIGNAITTLTSSLQFATKFSSGSIPRETFSTSSIHFFFSFVYLPFPVRHLFLVLSPTLCWSDRTLPRSTESAV